MKRGLLLLLLFVAPVLLPAQDSLVKPPPSRQLAVDSSDVRLREPPKDKQEEYYNDDYWRYGRGKDEAGKEEPGFFDRLFDRLIRSLENSLGGSGSGGGTSNFWGIFWLLVLVVLVVFAILKVTDSGVNRLFSGKRKNTENVDATLEDVDIHALDYDQVIAEAVGKKDYRLAVRLWFLRTLKELSDQELLHWKPEKTNSDYYYELSGSSFQDDFGKVSFVYDYIWYGEFPVDENEYRTAEERFRKFHNEIEAGS